MKKIMFVLSILFSLLMAVNASADLFVSDGSSSANFSLSGTTLTINLSYFSTNQVTDNSQVLQALFFNGAGLTPVSAILNQGATIFFQDGATPPPSGNVGGEWTYNSVLANAVNVNGATSGIGAAGLGAFGSSPNFNGNDLNSNAGGNIDGGDYGIISQGSVDGVTNDGIGLEPLIHFGVTFTLTTPANFSLTSINDVSFQYGTTLGEGGPVPPGGEVPEPISLILLGSGLAGAGLYKRLRKPR